MNKGVSFGLFNVETGETQKGYINKNGQMVYKKNPWWKVFSPPRETKYLGIANYYYEVIKWGIFRPSESYRVDLEVPVYKEYNPYTDKIYSVYALIDGGKHNFNIDAWINDNKLILI